MKRLHIFVIGTKYAWRLCKIQLALYLLNLGESCFLRLTGWKKDRLSPGERGVRWGRQNKSGGRTVCMTHAASAMTYSEIPQRIGIIQRACREEQVMAMTPRKPNEDSP